MWLCFVKWLKCCVFTILKQFGEIEDCQIDVSNLTAVITYRSRAEAEQVSHPPADLSFKHWNVVSTFPGFSAVWLIASAETPHMLSTFLLSTSQSQLWTHILSHTSNHVFSPSALLVSFTCRRLYMDWSWTTRLYTWHGISLLQLSALWMLMMQNQRRTRFVRLQIFFLFIDALKSGSIHFFLVLL